MSTRLTGNFNNYKTFTLLELLIVISILGILMTLLLPSLTKAKEHSKRAVCMSNMKQIGVGLQLHLKDHNGKYPARDDSKDFQFSWFGQKGNRANNKPYTRHPKNRSLNPYILGMEKDNIPEDIKVQMAGCPSDNFHYEDKGSSYNNNTYSKTGLENIKPYSVGTGQFRRNGNEIMKNVGINISQIESPARFVTFSEYGGDKSANAEAGATFNADVYFHTKEGKNYWNVLFTDAHVAFVRITPSLKTDEKYTYDRRD